TSEIRALAHPALEQRADRIEVSAIARQPIRLRERHELEMPIELPQVLDVADEPAVAMIERLAVRERRGNSRQRIGVPLRRKAEREAAPEEREQAPTNVVGNGEIRVGIGRGGGRRNVLDAAGRRPLGGRGVASANEPETLRSETNLPPRARGELVRGHRSRTIQIPLQTLHGPVARNSPPRVPSGRDQAHSVPQEWPTTCKWALALDPERARTRQRPEVKIAYLSHSPLLTQVANAIHVMQMCAAFAHLGHEVCLYARGRPGRTDDLFRAYGLEPARFRIALLPRGPWRFVGRSIYALMQVVRARVLDKPELYYARCPASAAFALLFGDVVLEIHELPRSRLERGLQRLTLKHPRLKRVVTISRALLDDLERAHRGLLDRVDCVGAPAGATLRPQATRFRLRRGPGRQIGYAGGLRPGNGICTIIALAEALPRDTFHVLGGAEDEVAAWRARQRSSNIVWYGHRDPACVPAFLESCDVLLAPYETGPKTVSGQDTSRWMSPLKIFEYMAAG